MKRISVVFYRSGNGRQPVRDWLKGLEPADRCHVGIELKTVEPGWPLGMPLVRKLSGQQGLWEVRCTLQHGRIARILFTVAGHDRVLLHAFIKKSQKTPPVDLALALQRKNNLGG